jgi:hypothetical protein
MFIVYWRWLTWEEEENLITEYKNIFSNIRPHIGVMFAF